MKLFIRTKKLIELLDFLQSEYNDSNKAPEGFKYACGNCNACNYIRDKLGLRAFK